MKTYRKDFKRNTYLEAVFLAYNFKVKNYFDQ